MKSAVSERWLRVDGLRIHYLAAGEAGSPVLLLHGGGLDSASLSWQPTLAALSRDHRIFAPDLPGYGQSDRPEQEIGIRYYVDLLGRMMDALQLERASLVGLSMGGGVALGFALDSPARVHKLVLVDSYGLGKEIPYGLLSYLLVRLPFINELTWWLMARSRRYARKALESIFYSSQTASEALIDEVYQQMKRLGAANSWIQFQRAELTAKGLRTDFLERLPQVTAPTLIIHGQHDRLVPVAWAERAHEKIPNSRLHILREAGHWSQREKPEEFHQVVSEFLVDP